jgi:nitroreductase
MQEFVDRFEEIPVVVLVCALRHREPNPFEGASVYPACQNLLLAARALGYGSTITLWHAGCEAALRELLGIPQHVWIAATMPLGRPVGGHGPLRRRPVADLVWDAGWEQPAPWVRDPPGSLHSSPRSASTTRFAPGKARR